VFIDCHAGLMKKAILSGLAIFYLCTGCMVSEADHKKLASEGVINKRAVLVTTATIEINASREYVWEIITDIPNWSKWNQAIPRIMATGTTYKGDNFTWKWNKKIYSNVRYFDKEKKLVWFSKSLLYTSIMVWEFEKISHNKTRVTVTESREGLFMYLASAHKHKKSLEDWLGSLKARCEVVIF